MTAREVQPEVRGETVTTAPSGAKLPSLTALRIVAATLVFLHHTAFQPVFSNQGLQNVYNTLAYTIGAISITFFFVLSGFVLTWTAKPTDSAKQFWRRRVVKIFPSHLVVYAVILVLMFVAGRAVRWPEALVSLPLLQSWVPNNDYFFYAINPPTWSLSIELLFYLSFPLLLVLVNRIRASRLWLYAGLTGVAALLVPLVSWLLLPGSPSGSDFDPFSWPQMWFNYFFPVARVFEFLIGMILAKILLAGRWPAVRPLYATVLLVALWAATLSTQHNMFDNVYRVLFNVPIALLITALAAADIAGRGTLLNNRGMVWLGEISYCFYLVHITVIFSLQAAFSHQWGLGGMFEAHPFGTVAGFAFLIAAYLACVFFGWLVYALVERPAMRRWARPKRPRPVTTT